MNVTTIDEDESVENFYEKQVLKLTTLVSASSIISNLLVAANILRHENLRRDVTYHIILHIAVVQVISLLLDEVVLWFFTYFGTPLPRYHAEFCAVFVGVRMLNAASFLMIVLLVCNWYCKVYSAYRLFQKFHRLFLVLSYAVSVVTFPFLTKLCLVKDVFATFYVVLSFQILVIVATTCANCVRKCRDAVDVKDIGLGVANIVVIFCTPAYIFLVLAYYGVVPVYTVLFADILATGVFPFVLLYLYRYDKNFQMYFRKLFVCRSGSLENESVSYNLINSIET